MEIFSFIKKNMLIKIVYIQSNLYINATQCKGTLKCCLYEQLPSIYRLKLYTLFINGKNETVLYRQLLVFIEVPFKTDLTVFHKKKYNKK